MMNYKIYAPDKHLQKMEDKIKETEIYIYDKKLDVDYLENGIIIPIEGLWDAKPYGGVVNEKGEIHKYSLRNYIYIDGKYSPNNYYGANPNTDLNKVKYIDEEIVFLGIGFNQRDYGHTIYESLSRLWYLLDKDLKNIKVAWIHPPSKDCMDLLLLFGLKQENIITIKEPTKYRKVIIPENSIELDFIFNIKYKEVINRIKENVNPSNFEKVYFSRNKLFYKRTLYEYILENTFKNNGYKIFYPEELSVYEKISIVKGCKYFAGLSASNAVHQIFAEDHTNIITITRSDYQYGVYVLSYFIKANLIILSGSNTFLPTAGGNGPFLIGGNEATFQFFKDFNFKYKKEDFYYDLYKVLDYLFVWAKTYKIGIIKNISIQELNNEEIADDIIDIYLNRIKKQSTLPTKTFFYIGMTTEIGSINIRPYFEIIIFGKTVMKINLNKYHVLKNILQIIPTKYFKNKFIDKFDLNSAAANDDSDNYFINMYNEYNNKKSKN